MTVYVIEDHPLMRDALTMLIHRVRPGLKVVPIPQMKLLDNAVEKNGFPELFCLDLQLPDTIGMSGVHIIKAKYPDVLLAVVTSADPSEFEDLCLQAGADVFIEKSNNPTQIIEVFRELLISPEMAAEEASSGAPDQTLQTPETTDSDAGPGPVQP
jgi:DNA-binding NarL/FixJ family response regulator